MSPSSTSPASVSRLSVDSVTVFQLLTERLDLLAEEIPAAVGLPRERTDAAMASLVRSGLARVIRLEGGVLRVELGSIAAVHSMLQRSQELGLPEEALQLLRARLLLGEILDHDSAEGPQIPRITDPAELEQRLAQIGSSTRHELFSLHAGEPLPPYVLNAHMATDLELLRRGIAVYMVYPLSFLTVEHLASYAAELQAAGAHIRFADALPHRLIVSDRSRAVVPIELNNPSRGALFTTEVAICRSLHHLAASIYRRSRPMSEINLDDMGGPPSPLERQVLILMNSGVTDLVAAKQLSVTDRTFRRYVADLLTRLGASSRFQAGVKAVERGWI